MTLRRDWIALAQLLGQRFGRAPRRAPQSPGGAQLPLVVPTALSALAPTPRWSEVGVGSVVEMPGWAVSFQRVGSRRRCAAQSVDAVRNHFEVGRVHAGPVTAEVVGLQPLRNSYSRQHQAHEVCLEHPPLWRLCSDSAVAVPRRTLPEPALLSRPGRHVPPEPHREREGGRWH